jgi:cysteine desulfurase
MKRVYLDHAATTPLDPDVLEAMRPYLTEHYGNASSVHALGRKARFAVEESRERIAGLIGAEPGEIVFTSGGTEADNLAIKGVLRHLAESQGTRPRLITSAAEHEAVLRPAEALKEDGWPVTILTPERHGAITRDQLAEALTDDVGLVSLMHANNETGVMTPIAEIAALCRDHDVLLHTDAVQTAGLFELDVDELGVDLLSMSGHKFYGPKGVGVLYVRGGVDLDPLVQGGSQERERRGGTENVASAVGMAEALERAVETAEAQRARLRTLQRRLIAGVTEAVGDGLIVNTPVDDGPVAPHIANFAFPPQEDARVDGEMLILNLDMEGVLASAGSACTSGALEPSHVLTALGLPRETAAAAVRFSLGKSTTEDDIDYAIDALSSIIQRMRS